MSTDIKKTVTFKVDALFHKHLVITAHARSLERQEHITLSDVIREALEKEYPLPSIESESDNG